MPYKPDAPTVYLDTSTLSQIFDSAAGTPLAKESCAPLVAWLPRVAERANLVLSLVHLAEFGLMRHDIADRLVSWLDSMPIAWSLMGMSLEEWEADRALEKILSLPSTPGGPFLAELADLIGGWPEGLGPPSILTFLRISRNSPKRTMFRDGSLEAARILKDRPQNLAEDLDRRILLRKVAMGAATRAGASQSAQDAFVSLYDTEPTSFAGLRWMPRFWSRFRERALRKPDLGSKRAKDAFSGQYADVLHVRIGAFHCDVFTCDRETSEALGDTRLRLGRGRELCLEGDGEEFVGALLKTLPI